MTQPLTEAIEALEFRDVQVLARPSAGGPAVVCLELGEGERTHFFLNLSDLRELSVFLYASYKALVERQQGCPVRAPETLQ